MAVHATKPLRVKCCHQLQFVLEHDKITQDLLMITFGVTATTEMQSLVSVIRKSTSPLITLFLAQETKFMNIYTRSQEEMERINAFQISTTNIFNSKPVIAPSLSF